MQANNSNTQQNQSQQEQEKEFSLEQNVDDKDINQDQLMSFLQKIKNSDSGDNQVDSIIGDVSKMWENQIQSQKE